ncbi:helix-turn-helix domain-containing protein [Hymenobacter cellulosivorans]|uniref:Helix-turn-helix transcriptional regulator n=1 Tax=Hymenobacter cellulosivorans TaxID=2932249 RepID=A0ABY4FGH1_9BACT|nr:helix-turn-helix transcriptional regulator [Hymenobacter cellulosivorans]UOQ55216.1 helix-turn-helix transcriptional regulator [Hymenobacter cellulosivorans]
MKKQENAPLRFASLSEAHRTLGLPPPLHPLISLVHAAPAPVASSGAHHAHVLSFYKISYRPRLSSRLLYGQGYYDFEEGGLLFAAPNQVIGGTQEQGVGACSQYTLLLHPDFLTGYPLAKKIRQYNFFTYSANEALHVSEQEKNLLLALFNTMEAELSSRLDEFSQDVVIAQLELLLTYAQRFYKRQFLTRKAVHSDLLQRLEATLADCFRPEDLLSRGIPTVQYLAECLHVSPSYLSDLLRTLTGQSAQQHIHDKLLAQAKEQLATTGLSVSEVAYALGFEHSQSFSRFFKTKTALSPLAFRRSFQHN